MSKIIFIINFVLLTVVYSNDSIYINVKDLKLFDLVNITSKAIDKTIVLPANFKGEVNLVRNISVKTSDILNILKIVLKQNSYKIKTINNILVIEKINEIKKNKKKQIIKVKTITKVVYLQNAKASNIKKVLVPILNKNQKLKLKTKVFISSDDESNSIILLGPKVYILDLVKVIKKLDNYRAQIFVTAKIIEINESKIKNVGLKYGIDAGYSNDNSLYTFASNLGGNSIAVDTTRLHLVLPTATKTIALGTSINLLNKEGVLDIISSPSLLCINNKESSIYIGQTKSFKTQSSINNSGVISEQSFKREDIGLKLIITPRISNTNKVLLDINTIIEDVSNTLTNGQPDTSKKEIKTTAIVNSGESVIIGGLIKKSIDSLEDKVAGFSSIPLIGGLFTNEQNVQDKISLVVIITPYVIPADKDLSYVRDQLIQLKVLEDKYTKDITTNLEKNKK